MRPRAFLHFRQALRRRAAVREHVPSKNTLPTVSSKISSPRCGAQFEFTFKGRAVDIKEVGRGLGVRYILEGPVTSGKVQKLHTRRRT
jgi:hypothetical protein